MSTDTLQVPPKRGQLPSTKVFIEDLPRHLDRVVLLEGWLVTVRHSRSLSFLVLKDRSGEIQCVCRDEQAASLKDLNPESALRVHGTARRGRQGAHSEIEIDVSEVSAAASAHAPLPLLPGATEEQRLDHRYLDLRHPKKQLAFRVQSHLEWAARNFLVQRGFLELHTPKITAGGSESGAAVFKLPYFSQQACLVQSPQFYMQMAMAAGMDRVYEVGPVFRAESAQTNRHATEFTCLDVEQSWLEDTGALMDLAEALLHEMLLAVRQRYGAEIMKSLGLPVEVPETPIPRLPLAMARQLSPDLASARLSHQAEQLLCKHARELSGHSFVFITDYPAADRPFYTRCHETAPSAAPLSCSFDLLWRGMEIASGCLREHRHDRLARQAAESGLDDQALSHYLRDFYLPMFRNGCPPHGGFGIGLDRLMMALMGQASIREASFAYRGSERYVP
ncbi:aspartate--tRNA(Asn) ligase [Mitsuaria sp. WAJ17]|uniref:aspartate--tRNA(Asn) ligase n=1 Tax=Mitsuaria sp. WAJ17 TaxID=2761452 RepID=UPI001603B683|nr:aspartate--tRNA(Asn) ligase [Mitsuaria sp. WAJ17]MBB2487893.1 aspartate--tRNA(Asn) ligase [Mitsuaria sp. WAJ17]